MEGSEKTGCSKTRRNEEDIGSESGEIDEEDDDKSSNSTVEEESDKKGSVRPYVRSKMPRLRWTPELHLCFIKAVERLGGQDRATPKLVLQLMNVNGLSIAHVKSHLQMFRSKKIDDPSQVLMGDHRQLVESGDRNIYNLSQLPMLQGYTQRHTSTYRYGDASWNARESFVYNSHMGRCLLDERRQVSYPTTNHSNSNWNNNTNSKLFQTPPSSFGAAPHSSWKSEHLKSQPEHHIFRQSNPRAADTNTTCRFVNVGGNNNNVQELRSMKRKAGDCNLDLDLSLKLTSGQEGTRTRQPGSLEESEIDSELSLSLYSPLSSSSAKLSRFKVTKENQRSSNHHHKENGKRTSTLDLTI
ncbi:Homeodomain-like superfamily protein [Euphorbia peplus]|nr:Homeodomain-like superfamily protein [Euphorbia peplus]